jgi:hypothetical protein
MVRNPSEFTRLLEEREEIISALKSNKIPPHSAFADKGLKSAKDALLRELRAIEGNLGIESIPYNSPEFGKLIWKT